MDQNTKLGVTQGLLEKAHQAIIDAYIKANLPAEVCSHIDREFAGGDCPRCQQPFKQIDVDNKHGKFTYFRPSCRCYPRCPGVHMDARTTTKRTDRGSIISRGERVRIDRDCGDSFPEEFITNNAVRCKICQTLVNHYRDKPDDTKVTTDTSRFRR